MAAWHSVDLEFTGQAANGSAQRKSKMKNLKPYIVPVLLGVLGALIYNKIRPRLPAVLQ